MSSTTGGEAKINGTNHTIIDCSSLINHVTNLENSRRLIRKEKKHDDDEDDDDDEMLLPSHGTTSFGHPVSPAIEMSNQIKVNGGDKINDQDYANIVIARTKHCISAQLILTKTKPPMEEVPQEEIQHDDGDGDGDEENRTNTAEIKNNREQVCGVPIKVIRLGDDDDTGLEGSNKEQSKSNQEYQKQHDKNDESKEDDSNGNEIITCATILTLDEELNEILNENSNSNVQQLKYRQIYFSVVLGTNHSRVLAIELRIILKENSSHLLEIIRSYDYCNAQMIEEEQGEEDEEEENKRKKSYYTASYFEPLPLDNDSSNDIDALSKTRKSKSLKKQPSSLPRTNSSLIMDPSDNNSDVIDNTKGIDGVNANANESEDEVSVQSRQSAKLNEVYTASATSTSHKRSMIDQESHQQIPFSPTGGVTGLESYLIPTGRTTTSTNANNDSGHNLSLFVWISYRDGTIIRLHHCCLFPCVVFHLHQHLIGDELTSNCTGEENEDVVMQGTNTTNPATSKDKIFSYIDKFLASSSKRMLVRSFVMNKDKNSCTIIPLPRYHPSPLAPLLQDKFDFDDNMADISRIEDVDDEDEDEAVPEFFEALSYGDNKRDFHCEKGTTIPTDFLPSLTFFTSENQYIDRFGLLSNGDNCYEDDHNGMNKGSSTERSQMNDDGGSGVIGGVIGGTKAVVGGIFGVAGGVAGAAYGAVKWGISGSSDSTKGTADISDHNHESNNESSNYDKNVDVNSKLQQIDNSQQPQLQEDRTRKGQSKPHTLEGANVSSVAKSSILFPNINNEICLYPGYEIHDAPRQVSDVSIDPNGNLAAVSDNLGRVLLIDLSTKQIIRMWKGVRDAKCYWIQVQRGNLDGTAEHQNKSTLYIAIHSKQRRVVDIWRTRHGSRIKSLQVGRDAQIIQCRQFTGEGTFAYTSCFLLHSTAPGSQQNQMEALLAEHDIYVGGKAHSSSSSQKEPIHHLASSWTQAALRLQLLKQLLSDTNVPPDKQAVYETFRQITSLVDICSALDLLAVATILEERMGVDGASFHSAVIAHCSKKLEEIIKDGDDDISDNPNVVQLSSKIAYHTQVVDAYEVLHKFEVRYDDHDNEEDEKYAVDTSSHWAVEGCAWIDTYENLTGLCYDSKNLSPLQEPLRFSAFCKACRLSSDEAREATAGMESKKNKFHVYFTESTKTRKEILIHLFRPLLCDIFSFKVVTSIFNALGISDNYDYLMICFGEWFMTLPAREAAKRAFHVMNPPIIRWLQDVVSNQFDSEVPPKVPLEPLLAFCSESDDLTRAFLLASVCREAVSLSSKSKEAKTYGKISWSDSISPWDIFLRKLRVCLLVSLRLHGVRLGAFPLTVKNVDDGDIFSIFEWVARDELLTSHNHEEIVSMENTMRSSGLVFHPSLKEGDEPIRWKRLQRACIAVQSEEGKTDDSMKIDNDDRPGALLLYLSNFNDPLALVAHRALLLGAKWGQQPTRLQILKDAVSALKSFDTTKQRSATLAAAVATEMWQTQIRPVYRAFFFGFDDVPELSEDIMAPLCHDTDWWGRFGQIAVETLKCLSSVLAELASVGDDTSVVKHTDQRVIAWPPVKEDIVIRRLLAKSRRQIDRNALDNHIVAVCAAIVSDDMSNLYQCVPDFYNTFENVSLFLDVVQSRDSTVIEDQRNFIERAIVFCCAKQGTESICFGDIDIMEIGTIAKIWQIPMETINTSILLTLFELGKSEVLEESFLASSKRKFDTDRLITEGTDIACRRLHNSLRELRRNSELRYILGLVDADTCEFIKERAERSRSLLEQYGNIPGLNYEMKMPLSSTHNFILRLMALNSGNNTENNASQLNIHSLSVLSGTLVMSLRDERQGQ